jgi:hypothetical protein
MTCAFSKLTAAGTVQVFHLIPFSSLMGTNAGANVEKESNLKAFSNKILNENAGLALGGLQ